MAESAADVHARILSVVGEGGRLKVSESVEWDSFPWEAADGALAAKVLPGVGEEPARRGEDGVNCEACLGFPEEQVVWEDERWVLTHRGGPSGLPVVLLLHSRDHLDFGRLDDDHASEMGRISNRLVRIIEGLPNIGRAHVGRWGDGAAHCHLWFFARTWGLVGVVGSRAAEWDDMIPAGPEEPWRQDLHTIAAKLANWGGDARA